MYSAEHADHLRQSIAKKNHSHVLRYVHLNNVALSSKLTSLTHAYGAIVLATLLVLLIVNMLPPKENHKYDP